MLAARSCAPRRSLPVLALAVVLAVMLGACSGSGSKPEAKTTPKTKTTTTTTTTTTIPPPKKLALAAGDVVVASVGPDVALDDATKQAVIAATQRYADLAVLGPISAGKVGDGYDALFDTSVKVPATGADRAALTDEGVPQANGPVDPNASPVRIDALVAGDGKLVFVATSFTLDVVAPTASGPLTVHRTTELTFAPGDANTWPITAYRVGATRETGSETSTTTAQSGTTAPVGGTTVGSTP